MQSHTPFSRRKFLKLGAAGAGVMLAAACTPAGVAPQGAADAGAAPAAEQIVLRLHMRAGGETSEVPIYYTIPNPQYP